MFKNSSYLINSLTKNETAKKNCDIFLLRVKKYSNSHFEIVWLLGASFTLLCRKYLLCIFCHKNVKACKIVYNAAESNKKPAKSFVEGMSETQCDKILDIFLKSFTKKKEL